MILKKILKILISVSGLLVGAVFLAALSKHNQLNKLESIFYLVAGLVMILNPVLLRKTDKYREKSPEITAAIERILAFLIIACSIWAFR